MLVVMETTESKILLFLRQVLETSASSSLRPKDLCISEIRTYSPTFMGNVGSNGNDRELSQQEIMNKTKLELLNLILNVHLHNNIIILNLALYVHLLQLPKAN